MKHVNICGVLDVFWEAPSTVWILMEFCSKGSLTERLKTASKQQVCHPSILVAGCLPLILLMMVNVKCYMWVIQLLEALAFVHARGMIHRDIKSENILMADNLVLKLGKLDSAHPRHLTTKAYPWLSVVA
jgi:serine/threonine protein kinase